MRRARQLTEQVISTRMAEEWIRIGLGLAGTGKPIRTATVGTESSYRESEKQVLEFLIHLDRSCVVCPEVCRFSQAFAGRSAMRDTTQNTSAISNSSVDEAPNKLGPESSGILEAEYVPICVSHIVADLTHDTPKTVKQFQPLRFAVGLCCTSTGVAVIMGVGLRVVEMHDISQDFAIPLVAVCVLTGVMLLGGGFGVMATSSSGFDEAEFDRLATAGNISAVSQYDRGDENRTTEDSHQSAA